MPGETAVYQFNPHLGDPHATYRGVDIRQSHRHRPEVPARFVASVRGETIIRTLRGRQTMRWQADPGTPCTILGYWSDGTVHLIWPGIQGHYRIDGRFPGWVVTEETNAARADDAHTLRSNVTAWPPRPSLVPRLALAVVLLAALVGLVGLGLAAALGGHLTGAG